jgi:hypothetical protein
VCGLCGVRSSLGNNTASFNSEFVDFQAWCLNI